MKPLKILAFSDMHGERRAVDMARALLEKGDYDLVVYLGDFSKAIGDTAANSADAAYLFDKLEPYAEVSSLFGNCDSEEFAKSLEKEGKSLHGKLIFKGNTAIIGWGGSHPTPFHTPMEPSETEIEEGLEKLIKEAASTGAEKLILFTHDAPARTKADLIPSGHVGSEAIRTIIEQHQPNIAICGHIHEAKSKDKVGTTDVFNVGPASEGNFLEITVGEDLSAKEIKV